MHEHSLSLLLKTMFDNVKLRRYTKTEKKEISETLDEPLILQYPRQLQFRHN